MKLADTKLTDEQKLDEAASETPFWVITIVCILTLIAYALAARLDLLPVGW